MKKFTACLLALAMLFSAIGAMATSGTVSNSVHEYAFYSENGVFDRWASYDSTTESWNLEMQPGDYATITPVFHIDTQYLSYTLSGVSSSDSSVVDGQFYNQSSGDLGIRLHAKKPGTATVTASFGHYLTSAGAAKYRDRVDKHDFTYTANVTVTGGGSVTIDLNASGGGYGSVKGATVSRQRLYDTLSPEEQKAVRDVSGGNMSGAVSESDRADANAASEALSEARERLSGGGIRSCPAALRPSARCKSR